MTRRTRRVRSTGAEATPAAPVTTQAVIGVPTSTGAEPFDDQPVTTRVSYLDEPVVVQSPTPGPVTMTVGWLADTDTDPDPEADSGAVVEAKVVEPSERPARPGPARTRAQTKTSRTRGGTGDG
jgi:hypothetical protein